MGFYTLLEMRQRNLGGDHVRMALYTPLKQKGTARLFAKTSQSTDGQAWKSIEFFPLLTEQSTGIGSIDKDVAFEEAWRCLSLDPTFRNGINQMVMMYLKDNRNDSLKTSITENVLMDDLHDIHQGEIRQALATLHELDLIERQKEFVYLSPLGIKYLSKGDAVFF